MPKRQGRLDLIPIMARRALAVKPPPTAATQPIFTHY
jgi:hypothetical protein